MSPLLVWVCFCLYHCYLLGVLMKWLHFPSKKKNNKIYYFSYYFSPMPKPKLTVQCVHYTAKSFEILDGQKWWNASWWSLRSSRTSPTLSPKAAVTTPTFPTSLRSPSVSSSNIAFLISCPNHSSLNLSVLLFSSVKIDFFFHWFCFYIWGILLLMIVDS
jgi:hypothetical protein